MHLPLTLRANSARVALALLATAAVSQAQTITRSRFTPTVVPETFTDPVRFEVTVSPAVASVNFNYNAANRPMSDDGANGDLVAGIFSTAPPTRAACRTGPRVTWPST